MAEELNDVRAAPADFIKAPWDSATVDALNRYQRLGFVHEFTCSNPHDGADRSLYATVAGWRCPHCDYRQDWAHAGMLKAGDQFNLLPCDVLLPPATMFRKGTDFAVMMTGLRVRSTFPAAECRFDDPGAAIGASKLK